MVTPKFRFQGVRHLVAVLRHALQIQRSPRNAVFQCLSFKKFHDDEVLAFILVYVINRADMGMVERRRGPCFALKPFDRQGFAGKLFGEKF